MPCLYYTAYYTYMKYQALNEYILTRQVTRSLIEQVEEV